MVHDPLSKLPLSLITFLRTDSDGDLLLSHDELSTASQSGIPLNWSAKFEDIDALETIDDHLAPNEILHYERITGQQKTWRQAKWAYQAQESAKPEPNGELRHKAFAVRYALLRIGISKDRINNLFEIFDKFTNPIARHKAMDLAYAIFSEFSFDVESFPYFSTKTDIIEEQAFLQGLKRYQKAFERLAMLGQKDKVAWYELTRSFFSKFDSLDKLEKAVESKLDAIRINGSTGDCSLTFDDEDMQDMHRRISEREKNPNRQFLVKIMPIHKPLIAKVLSLGISPEDFFVLMGSQMDYVDEVVLYKLSQTMYLPLIHDLIINRQQTGIAIEYARTVFLMGNLDSFYSDAKKIGYSILRTIDDYCELAGIDRSDLKNCTYIPETLLNWKAIYALNLSKDVKDGLWNLIWMSDKHAGWSSGFHIVLKALKAADIPSSELLEQIWILFNGFPDAGYIHEGPYVRFRPIDDVTLVLEILERDFGVETQNLWSTFTRLLGGETNLERYSWNFFKFLETAKTWGWSLEEFEIFCKTMRQSNFSIEEISALFGKRRGGPRRSSKEFATQLMRLHEQNGIVHFGRLSLEILDFMLRPHRPSRPRLILTMAFWDSSEVFRRLDQAIEPFINEGYDIDVAEVSDKDKFSNHIERAAAQIPWGTWLTAAHGRAENIFLSWNETFRIGSDTRQIKLALSNLKATDLDIIFISCSTAAEKHEFGPVFAQWFAQQLDRPVWGLARSSFDDSVYERLKFNEEGRFLGLAEERYFGFCTPKGCKYVDDKEKW